MHSSHVSKRRKASLHALAAVSFSVSLSAFAQGGNQGTLQGTITDSSGAVLPNATVTIANPSRGTTFTVHTGRGGSFTIPVVPVGFYDVKVEHAGFATVERKGVDVEVGARVDLPIALPVASNEATIEVQTGAPVVDITRTNASESINERAVANLPVLGRNFLDFTLTTPGVTRDVRTGDLSFAGQRGTLNSLTIDGADNNNTFFGQTLGRTGSGRAPYQFSQDAVEEFQVNTSTFAPEFGRAGGALINVVTKSGTNKFHGTIFEFYRDRRLNANDEVYSLQSSYFLRGLRSTAPIRPGYHFNQFGGNVGGPVLKDKLFFFFDYDGQRNTVGIPVALNIPAIAAPTAAQTTAINYLTARSQTYITTFNQDVYLGKLDYRFNAANLISARYNGQRFTGTNLENSGTTSAAEHTGNSNVNTDTFALEINTTINQHFINQLRGSYQRDNEPGLANSQNAEAAVRQNGTTLLTVGRNNFSPRETTLHRQQYADSVTYVAGTHTLKVGVDFLRDQILNFFPGNFSGAYTFDSLEDFGRSILGQPLQATATGSSALQLIQAYAGAGTSGPTTHPDNAQIAGFAQDDWHANHRLQLTYGVRYDRQSYHQPGVVNPLALTTGFNTSTIQVDNLNFQPRLGIAYQPYGNSDRTVIRAGGGIFYGNTPSILTGTASSNNGVNLQTFTFQPSLAPAPGNPNATGTPTFPAGANYPNSTCGAPVNAPNCAPPTGFAAAKSNIFLFANQYHQPRVVQYNAQVQQQLFRDTSLTVGYLGARGTRLTRTRNANFVTEAPATITNTAGQVFTYQKINDNILINPNFNQVYLFESTAHSDYNGLTAQLDKRFTGGLQFSAAYTWSKVIDDAPDATAVVVGSDDAKEAYDPLNPRADLAPGNDDTRHRFVFSDVWDLDYFTRNLRGVTRQVAGGWSISSIVTAQSGLPYTALINTSLNGSLLTANQRTPGSSRNQYRLPNFYSVDPRITKTLGFEHARLLLIGEAFNVLNHSNLTGVNRQQYVVTNNVLVPNTNPTTGFQTPSAFGSNASYNGRVIQLAAKIQF